jgi:hypothetical protein
MFSTNFGWGLVRAQLAQYGGCASHVGDTFCLTGLTLSAHRAPPCTGRPDNHVTRDPAPAPHCGLRRGRGLRRGLPPWREARPGVARAGDSVIGVYERAMAQVWMRLEALAQQHGVMDQLQVFVSVRACAPRRLQHCYITS